MTAPKMPKFVRTIVMPEFLVGEAIDFMRCIPDLQGGDRLILVTKSFFAPRNGSRREGDGGKAHPHP